MQTVLICSFSWGGSPSMTKFISISSYTNSLGKSNSDLFIAKIREECGFGTNSEADIKVLDKTQFKKFRATETIVKFSKGCLNGRCPLYSLSTSINYEISKCKFIGISYANESYKLKYLENSKYSTNNELLKWCLDNNKCSAWNVPISINSNIFLIRNYNNKISRNVTTQIITEWK